MTPTLLRSSPDNQAERANPLHARDAPDRARTGQAAVWLAKIAAGWTAHDLAVRVLVSGNEAIPHGYALEISRILARQGDAVLLVDASQGRASLSSPLELPRSPGLAELCQDKTSFDAVLRRDAQTRCHFIAAGRPRTVGGPWGEPGAMDRVFRALDEIYQWIVVCAESDEGVGLAVNMKRHFAAAVIVEDRDRRRNAHLRDMLSRQTVPVLRIPERSR